MRRKKYIAFLFLLCDFIAGSLLYSQGIVIESGAKIVITGSGKIEITDGDFTNNGTFTKGMDTLVFSGTTAAQILGSVNTDFHQVLIENTGGVTMQIAEVSTNDLNVASGASFIVAAGKLLTVGGDLTNDAGDAGFIIYSDASSEGSLKVSGAASGNVNYKRYLTADEWHFIAAPVSGMSINTFVTEVANSIATNDVRYGLAPYDNDAADWNHYQMSGSNLASDAGNFVSGKGYEVLRTGSSGTVDFTGTVPTSDVSHSITVGSGNAWNLVGNPFPSAINGNDDAHATNNFLTVNTAALHDSYEAIYAWDPSISGFRAINHVYQSNTAFYIAPGQAFFVYSANGGGTLDLTEAMQAAYTGSFLKAGSGRDTHILLSAVSDKGTITTQIYFLENTTAGLDPGYDAGMYSKGNDPYCIYTKLAGDSLNDVAFEIQCLSLFDFEQSIPVGLNVPAGVDVSLHIEQTSLPEDAELFLEDREKETFISLGKEGETYNFNSGDGLYSGGRFFLHTRKDASGFDSYVEPDKLALIPHPLSRSLKIISSLSGACTLEVFDISGHRMLLEHYDVHGDFEADISSLPSGIYIARLHSESDILSKKFNWIH